MSNSTVSRFRLAIPSHSLPTSQHFYTSILGAFQTHQTPSSTTFSFFNHTLTLFHAGDNFTP